MKSGHRHDLQTNDLRKLAKKAGEFLQKNARLLSIVICAVAVLVIAGLIFAMQSQSEKETSWTSFSASMNAEALAKVADDYEGTVAGAWARLREAEINLQQGVNVAFTERPAAGIAEISELKQAKQGFDNLVNGKSVPSAVRERALIGLARYLETTCDGNTQTAIQAYRRFIADFPDSSQRELAEQRMTALETDATKDFYAWFFKQKPEPKDTEKPFDGSPFGDLKLDDEPTSDDATTSGSESKTIEFPSSPQSDPFKKSDGESTPLKSDKKSESESSAPAKDDSNRDENSKSPPANQSSQDQGEKPTSDKPKDGTSKSDDGTTKAENRGQTDQPK